MHIAKVNFTPFYADKIEYTISSSYDAMLNDSVSWVDGDSWHLTHDTSVREAVANGIVNGVFSNLS